MTPDDLLIAIAGHGLHPSQLPVTARPLATEAWQELLAALNRELVLGLALHAADCGALPVTTAQREDLTDRLALAQDRRSAADRCLDEVVAALRPLHWTTTSRGFASMTRSTCSSLRRNRRKP